MHDSFYVLVVPPVDLICDWQQVLWCLVLVKFSPFRYLTNGGSWLTRYALRHIKNMCYCVHYKFYEYTFALTCSVLCTLLTCKLHKKFKTKSNFIRRLKFMLVLFVGCLEALRHQSFCCYHIWIRTGKCMYNVAKWIYLSVYHPKWKYIIRVSFLCETHNR